MMAPHNERHYASNVCHDMLKLARNEVWNVIETGNMV